VARRGGLEVLDECDGVLVALAVIYLAITEI
jgi:hypothetical protein